MRIYRPGSELWVELRAHEETFVRKLEYLHDLLPRGAAREYHAVLLQGLYVLGIHVPPVAESLPRMVLPVKLVGKASFLYCQVEASEPHCPSKALYLLLLGKYANHGMRGLVIYLSAVRPLQAAHVAGELYHSHLEAETETEIREVVLPRVAYALYLPFCSSLPEASGDYYPVHPFHLLLHVISPHVRGLYPLYGRLGSHVRGRVLYGLEYAQVGIMDRGVLAHYPDCDLLFRGVYLPHEILPLVVLFPAVPLPLPELQDLDYLLVHARILQEERDFVDVVYVVAVYHPLHGHVRVYAYLLPYFVAHGSLAPTYDYVALYPHAHH